MIDIKGNVIPNYEYEKQRSIIPMYTVYVNGNPYGECYITDVPGLYRQLKRNKIVSEGVDFDHNTQSIYMR